jgi:hypothetical protein
MRITAVLVGVLVLTGCSAGSGYVVDESGDGVLVSAASSPDVQMQALISGELTITASGCFGIGDTPAIFPVGTVRDGDGLDVPGLGNIDLGDAVEFGGGSVPISDGIPEECAGDVVAVLNPIAK